MSIRRALRSDLRAMAEVSAAAFMDEELHGPLMHPYRKQYPEDFILFFENKFLRHWHDPRRHFLVGLDPTSGRVAALAVWHRQGNETTPPASWRESGLARGIGACYERATSYLWPAPPNRAADPAKADILAESFPFFARFWEGERAENWFLDLLATHPDSQRRGLGRQLVEWGVEEARRENVCASVISSLGSERFYEKSGFVEVGRANVGPLEENGIQGGAIMFRDIAVVGGEA